MNRPLALALALLLALAAAGAGPAALAGPRDPAGDGRLGIAAVEAFANHDGIAVPDPSRTPDSARKAAPYPSPIEVSGIPGESKIADLDLTLHGFSHDGPDALDILLVGPQGQTALVMSDVGAGKRVSGLTLTLDDEAAERLATDAPLTSGTFRPTNAAQNDDHDPSDRFPAPAPAHDGGAALSAFDGTDPNGTWKLYVAWDTQGIGSLAGWSLRITDGGRPPLAEDDAYRVKEDRALRKDAAGGVLANDADPEGDPLTVAVAEGPAKGTLTLNADGSFAYKPKRNFHGTDRFTYEVTDAQGFADRATATIKVLARPG